MIKVQSKINIKSRQEKIWNFLNNISLGLSFNRFHTKINTQNSFSIDQDKNITIEHNFGFGKYDMILTLLESSPNYKIVFEEKSKDVKDELFNHKTTFTINQKTHNLSELKYIVEGTFKNKFADLSFKPILKGVMLDELIKMKLAIESSESDRNQNQYNPV
mgnify:CR=1 FL=1